VGGGESRNNEMLVTSAQEAVSRTMGKKVAEEEDEDEDEDEEDEDIDDDDEMALEKMRRRTMNLLKEQRKLKRQAKSL
jgi:hypothetical protein